MSRPTRTRRVPLKFSENENILEPKSRKTREKIAGANGDSKVTPKDALNVVATKSRSAKGNLLAGKETVVAQTPRSPVLRDRTNLPAEPFKVDILVKKGADYETTETTARPTRQTAKAAASENVKSEAPGKTKSSGQTKAANLPTAKVTTKNLPTEKENARKMTTEKENARKMSALKENNVPSAKEKSNNGTVKEKAKNELGKKKAKNEPAKETLKKEPAKDEEKNAQTKEKTKKLKAAKAAALSDNEDNSLVIESENVAATAETPKVRSAKATPKKIGKRVAFSKLSLSKQANKSVENRKKKSMRRSSKLEQKGEERPATGEGTVGRKFFKSKGTATANNEKKVLPDKKIVTSRVRKVEARAKPRVSTSFRLRQTTLGESFAKQAARKNLRPRVAQKDYHEQSTVLEKTATSGKRSGPVYKTAKLLDKSDDDTSEIYEFHFDRNDSRERIAKKRKKRVRNGVVTRKTRAKASGAKKTITKPKAAAESAAVMDIVEESPRTAFPANSDEPMDTNDVPAIVVSNFDLPPVTTLPVQPKRVESQPGNVATTAAKPRIVENVELTGESRINLTSTPQLAKSAEAKARPLRTTNAFNIRPSGQYRTMLSHALLNKSLSPIKKALENFDPGSPWRPPAITGPQFSRIKNIVQSTPHERKFSGILEKMRNSVDPKAETGLAAATRMNKIVEKDENNANAEQASIKKTPQKVFGPAKSPRKFGTVISNVNVSNSSGGPAVINKNNDISETNRVTPREIADAAPPPLVHLSETGISDAHDAADNFDDNADKENSVPLFTSPKKSLKSPKKFLPKKSPLRPSNHLKTATKENWEPQPGPSGLQKRSPLGELKVLRQTNLNNFLNIDEVPTSTRISGAHGIFADTHSTPINGKPVKTFAREPNVENAFGFDDIGGDIDLSPIKSDSFACPKVAAAKKEKKSATVPTRFSIGEIKKHCRPIDEVEQRLKEEPKGKQKINEEKTASKNEKDSETVEFSNTFDVLAQADEENCEENVKEIPLFADLEPVHFKQPPRHSYKRKRIVAFNFSEDDDENFAEHDNHEKKKRKISKVEKQRQKKMEEWAKDINNTFEEIDHFDLVVE